MPKLLEKYLSQVHFKTTTSRYIPRPKEEVFAALQSLSFCDAPVTKWLFETRGVKTPTSLNEIGTANCPFVFLEQDQANILIGIAGQFWKPKGDLQQLSADQFAGFDQDEYAKAIWLFSVAAHKEGTIATASLHIECLSESTKKRFALYWWLVKPISAFTRRELLKALSKKLSA